MEKFWDLFALEEHDLSHIEPFVLSRYCGVMQRFLDDRDLIPPENLYEIRHEDFVLDPVNSVNRIYRQFGLARSADDECRQEAYAKSIADYQTANESHDPRVVRLVQEQWKFAHEQWGYELRPE